MKFLAIVSPPSIYHGCSTRKTFWEEKFAGKKQDLFEPVNMRNCGKRNVRKHKEFKKGDESVTDENKYEILEISDKFDILDMMETTSSESKAKLGRSGKVLVTALTPSTKERSTKYKMARYDIINVSKKDLVNKITEFEFFLRYLMPKRNPNMNQLRATFT